MRYGRKESFTTYLEPGQLDDLKRLSRRTKTPMSALLRLALDSLLRRDYDHRQAEAPTPKQTS